MRSPDGLGSCLIQLLNQNYRRRRSDCSEYIRILYIGEPEHIHRSFWYRKKLVSLSRDNYSYGRRVSPYQRVLSTNRKGNDCDTIRRSELAQPDDDSFRR